MIVCSDFKHYEEEIDRLRKELKPKVNRLNDLEHKDGLKGFDLLPLHEKELSKVMANLDWNLLTKCVIPWILVFSCELESCL